MLERLKEILIEATGNADIEVTEASVLTKDLGINSYDLVELVCNVEDEFDVEIPDKVLRRFVTVGDLISYIQENC